MGDLPHAFRCGRLNHLTFFSEDTDMSVPICTILMWYGNPLHRPLGYEYCNGNIFDIVTFPDLYGYLISANPALYVSPTEARLPDLRGEFLRGWDDSPNIDPNRLIGDSQKHTLASHSHQIGDGVAIALGWPASFGGGPGHAVRHAAAGDTPFNTVSAGGSETRPRNVAVSFLVKSKLSGEERPLKEIVEELAKNHSHEDFYKALKALVEKTHKK